MKKTIENCTVIKTGIKQLFGEPKTINGKCEGYVDDGEESIDLCKRCHWLERGEE